MNIQSIDKTTERASGIVMLGMGGVRVAELAEDTYRWINKIDKQVPFKLQTSPKLVRGLSSVALVGSLWYGYRAANHLYHGTSEDEVHDWLKVLGAGLSVANLGFWIFSPAGRLGACPLFFRHATFFGGLTLDAIGLAYLAHQGASFEELAMQLGMLLVFNTGREDRAIYGQYAKKITGFFTRPLAPSRQGRGDTRGELVYLDDYRPKSPNDTNPDPQANEAALLMAAGAESVPFPNWIGCRPQVIAGERVPLRGIDVFASTKDIPSPLMGEGQGEGGVFPSGRSTLPFTLPLASSRQGRGEIWRILDAEHFAYPRLGEALPAILTHPETVHATTSIPRDRLRLVEGVRDWIANDVFAKWDKDRRPLSHSEQLEIKQALELRLQAVARIDPGFIQFFHKLYDGDYRQDDVIASPHMIGTPLDSALTHLWGLLIGPIRWGEASMMTGEDIDFFSSVPKRLTYKPVILNGEKDPHFYILESPGFEETSGGIDRSLWYKGRYQLTKGRDFRELMDEYKKPGRYRGHVLLATAGYKRTPQGYVTELVQGEPELTDVSINISSQGFKPLMNVLTQRFGHHPTWIAKNLLDDLRRSDPTYPIYFRRPPYMNCIDCRLVAEKPSARYRGDYRDLGHAVSQLSPVKIKKMLQAKERELQRERDRLWAKISPNPDSGKNVFKYIRVVELDELLGYAANIERTWTKLTRIANTLGFKLEDPKSSVMVLRP